MSTPTPDEREEAVEMANHLIGYLETYGHSAKTDRDGIQGPMDQLLHHWAWLALPPNMRKMYGKPRIF